VSWYASADADTRGSDPPGLLFRSLVSIIALPVRAALLFLAWRCAHAEKRALTAFLLDEAGKLPH
jgi:hypothetical protein